MDDKQGTTSEETLDQHFNKTERLLNELHNSGISISEVQNDKGTTPKNKINEKQSKINEKIIELAEHLEKKLGKNTIIPANESKTEKLEIFKKTSETSLLNKIYKKIPEIYPDEKLFVIHGNDQNTLIIPTWYRSSHPGYKSLTEEEKNLPDNFRIRIDPNGNVSCYLACTANQRKKASVVSEEYQQAIEWRYSPEVEQEVQWQINRIKGNTNQGPSDETPKQQKTIIVNNLMTNTDDPLGLGVRGWLLKILSLTGCSEGVTQDRRSRVMKDAINDLKNQADQADQADLPKFEYVQTQVSGNNYGNHIGLSDHKLDANRIKEIIGIFEAKLKELEDKNESEKITHMIQELKKINNKPTITKSVLAHVTPLAIAVTIGVTAFALTNPVGSAAVGVLIGCTLVTIIGNIIGKAIVGHSAKDRFLMSGYIDAISSKLPNVECWSSCKSGQDRTAAHETVTEGILKAYDMGDIHKTPNDKDSEENLNRYIQNVYNHKKTTGAISKAATYVKIRLSKTFGGGIENNIRKAIDNNEKQKKFAHVILDSQNDNDSIENGNNYDKTRPLLTP